MPAEFAAFHFLRPAWGLLLLPTALLLWYLWRQPGEPQRFAHIIAPHLLEHLRIGRYRSRWFNPRTASCLLLVLLALILMGPTWRQQPSPLHQDEAAMVLLLDASESMSERDIQPSRLERAKQKISDLLALSPDKKAALIVYAGSAHTVLSLTTDRDILRQYLDAITPAIMPRSGKFPEYALPRVDAVLREQDGPATVVLFSDGTGSDSEAAFREYFDNHPHQLLVLGVGSEGETDIPLDRQGLERLARAGGGHYVALTVNDSDVRAIDRAVGSYYIPVADDALPWLDSGYPLVFPAMALFLLWFRKGWTLSWAWLLGALWLSPAPPLSAAEDPNTASAPPPASHWFADLWLTPDQQGRLLMQRGQYREAAARFRDPQWKALALYYAEDFMQAAEYFSRSDRNGALFNEANARAHARDYLRAVRLYNRLLARDPDFPGARHNRDRVQAVIDEINRLSESQQAEPGEDSNELGEDDPRAAEGADEKTWQKKEIVQLTAEQVLGSEATRDMWLRGVQKDPSGFLAIKFSMQLAQPDQAAPAAPGAAGETSP
jgi:Ca-activated chloride channel homolog